MFLKSDTVKDFYLDYGWQKFENTFIEKVHSFLFLDWTDDIDFHSESVIFLIEPEKMKMLYEKFM
jgi:hypothetical protein